MVRTVGSAIFVRRYFGHCMSCGFCADACCQHGVDVSIVERARIMDRADELAHLVATPVSEWFESETSPDDEFSGGGATRTTVVNGQCVFLRLNGRGCVLHAASLAAGRDYHLLKPMVSALFPVTFGEGTLLCAIELVDGSLACVGEGPTAYEMARGELAWYFGDALVAELDDLAVIR